MRGHIIAEDRFLHQGIDHHMFVTGIDNTENEYRFEVRRILPGGDQPETEFEKTLDFSARLAQGTGGSDPVPVGGNRSTRRVARFLRVRLRRTLGQTTSFDCVGNSSTLRVDEFIGVRLRRTPRQTTYLRLPPEQPSSHLHSIWNRFSSCWLNLRSSRRLRCRRRCGADCGSARPHRGRTR